MELKPQPTNGPNENLMPEYWNNGIIKKEYWNGGIME
jgi:hypothetical protein